eukprot:g13736.t2
MKTIAVLGTIGLALVVRNAEAFFLPAGNLVGGASTTAPLTVNSGSGSSSRIVARAAARGSGAEPCACSVCTSRPGGRGASSATVIRMGAGQVSDAGEGIRERLVEEPGSVMFEEAMGAIEAGFDYTPKRL